MTRGKYDDELPRSGARRPGARRSFDPEAARLEEEERRAAEEEKKRGRKRLFNLVGNETACLVIIFGMIASCNWMASDFSGEYLVRDKKLGLVKLSIIRRAASVDADLYYDKTAALEMRGGKGEMGKQLDFTFEAAENPPYPPPPYALKRSRFVGVIDGTCAEGVIVDKNGSHEIKLTKNLLASLFSQLQAHLPVLPSFRPPTFFRTEDHLRPPQNYKSIQ